MYNFLHLLFSQLPSKTEENFPRNFNFYNVDVADQVPGISEMVPLKSSTELNDASQSLDVLHGCLRRIIYRCIFFNRQFIPYFVYSTQPGPGSGFGIPVDIHHSLEAGTGIRLFILHNLDLDPDSFNLNTKLRI